MIVKMAKTFIAVRLTDRERLLDRLGAMNLLHLEPVEPKQAVADEETRDALADLERAIQILSRPRARRLRYTQLFENIRYVCLICMTA